MSDHHGPAPAKASGSGGGGGGGGGGGAGFLTFTTGVLMLVGSAILVLSLEELRKNPGLANALALTVTLAAFFIPFWIFRFFNADEHAQSDTLTRLLAAWSAFYLWWHIQWVLWHPVYDGPFRGTFGSHLIISLPLAALAWYALNWVHGPPERFIARRFGNNPT
ncbi:MAG: hypothetical protein WC813_00970 [Patescibacteria group bacterium]|jgi:hypothetical protein